MSNESNEITKGLISMTSTVLEKFQELDDFIDDNLETISDLTDTAGDLIAPARFAGKLIDWNRKRKFKVFLKGYAKELTDSFPTADKEKLAQRMGDYLKRPKNLEFVVNSIQAAIDNNSIYCSAILGYLTGYMLTEDRDVRYKDLVFMRALKDVTDSELASFIRVYEKTGDKRGSYEVKDLEDIRLYKDDCELAVQKFKYLLILSEQFNPRGSYQGAKSYGKYSVDEFGEDFYILIRWCKKLCVNVR